MLNEETPPKQSLGKKTWLAERHGWKAIVSVCLRRTAGMRLFDHSSNTLSRSHIHILKHFSVFVG